MNDQQTDAELTLDLKLERAKRRRTLVIVQFAIAIVVITLSAILVAFPFVFESVSEYAPLLAVAGGAIGGASIMLWTVFRRASRQLKQVAFVSYSQKDEEFVNELIAELEKKGVAIVQAKDTIRVGDNIRLRIRELMSQCSHVLVIASPNYEESKWATIELWMISRDAKIVPVLYRTQEPLGGLGDVQYAKADAVTPDLVDELVSVLPQM